LSIIKNRLGGRILFCSWRSGQCSTIYCKWDYRYLVFGKG